VCVFPLLPLPLFPLFFLFFFLFFFLSPCGAFRARWRAYFFIEADLTRLNAVCSRCAL
jgi:hypothetical protein